MYRKFSAGYIFTGYEFVQKKVLITDADGVVIELADENEAGDDVEKLNGILSPGFINAHCHLELSHMKGLIPKHTGLVDFVFKIINERHFSEAEILTAIETAENSMLQSGIVAVGDICNNALTIPQKKKGNLLYHNFIETAGFPPAIAEQRFSKAVDLFKTYAEKFSASSIAPHAPYSVSSQLFGLINEFPGNNLLTIHNQETEAETTFFKEGLGDFVRLYQQLGVDISFFKPSGKSSLQTFLPYFTNGQQLILVHNVCTSEEDVKFTKLRIANCELPTAFFCLCPNANMYISNLLPDVKMLMQHTESIVLGTDSLASNDQLSILEEMKTLQTNFKELNLSTLLKWSTSNGARGLQMDNKLGDFEKGKKPGVVLINNISTDELQKPLLLSANSVSKKIL